MNKSDFLNNLRQSLNRLPQKDVEQSIEYYSEIIDDSMEDGTSEEDAVNALGPIAEIVQQIQMAMPLPKLVSAAARSSSSAHDWRAWEIILLVLGAPFWIPIVFMLVTLFAMFYFLLWMMVFMLYIIDFTLAVSGAGLLFRGIIALMQGHFAIAGMHNGVGLFCIGAAILSFFPFKKITAGLIWLSKKFILWIKSLFVKG